MSLKVKWVGGKTFQGENNGTEMNLWVSLSAPEVANLFWIGLKNCSVRLNLPVSLYSKSSNGGSKISKEKLYFRGAWVA